MLEALLPMMTSTGGSLVLNEKPPQTTSYHYEAPLPSYGLWISNTISLHSTYDTRYLTMEEQHVFRMARLKAGRRIEG